MSNIDNMRTPKYIRLKESIREYIDTNDMSPDSQIPSRNELIRTYGVSDVTVRKAIEELTSEGYLYSMQGKGVFVADRKAKPLTIGLVISHLRGSDDIYDTNFMTPLTHYIEDEAHRYNARILLCLDNYNPELERKNLRDLIEREVDGIIIYYIGGDNNLDALRMVQDAGIPLVMMDIHTDQIDTDYVITDNLAGAYHCTKHMLSLGLNSIIYLDGCDYSATTRNRVQGYTKAIREYQLPITSHIINLTAHRTGVEFDEEAYSITKTLIKDIEPPFGIFTVCTSPLSGVWRCLNECRIDQSEYVLACFDEPIIHTAGEVRLIRVLQPLEEIGRRCVRILTDHIEGHNEIQRVVLPAQICLPETLQVEAHV